MLVRSRPRTWLLRYGPPEVAGTAASALTAVAAVGTGAAAVAVLAAWAETVAYYAVATVREVRALAGRSLPRRTAAALRGVVAEFGVAEVADTVVLRPALMYAFVGPLGNVVVGVVAGKLAADVAFYALVIPAYELRTRSR